MRDADKKRICFIAQFPPPVHGLSKAVETLYRSELADAFTLEKVDITNSGRILGNLRRICASKADLFYFTVSQTRGGNLRDLVILELLALRRKDCLIHLHGGYYRQLVDDDLPAWQRKANYRAVGRLAGAVALGPSLRPIFSGMLPEEKIFTVPNCVDDEYVMSGVDFQEKVCTLDRRPVKHVLYLSNFIRTKGYPEVLQMAGMEKERAAAGEPRRFHFDFAGKFFEPPEEAFFRNTVKENGLEDFVSFHGIVGGDRKRELLRQCDVFALLTRYPNEGQPISILEAMANGMAVMTTDHAGIPDQITDGVNGIVARKDRVDARVCYDRLLRLSADDLKRMSIRNREDALTKFSQESYVRNMTACCDSILKQGAGR